MLIHLLVYVEITSTNYLSLKLFFLYVIFYSASVFSVNSLLSFISLSLVLNMFSQLE